MRKAISLLFITVFSLALLLAGCGNNEQAASGLEDLPSTSVETSSETAVSAVLGVSGSEQESAGPELDRASPSSLAQESEAVGNETNEEENSGMQMYVQIGESTFTATLEENTSVDALIEMMEQGPVTIAMSDYSGFEKVGPLGTSLPTSNQQTTTQAGDIVLYQGNQIVLFYGSNSWSYTRLGHINDLAGWEEALGSGDVTVTFALEG